MIPEIAAGKTTLTAVVDRRAPMPNDASRSSRGTARSASSATDATNGVVSSPTASPAASSVNAWLADGKNRTTRSGLMKLIAK